jgi:hypothetical protein
MPVNGPKWILRAVNEAAECDTPKPIHGNTWIVGEKAIVSRLVACHLLEMKR